MKITAIIGTGKYGNTYKTLKFIEEEMIKEVPGLEFNYIILRDINLGFCKGCFKCIKAGEELCGIKDDKDEIKKMLEKSQGIIFATPVYANNISALMKNFLERFVYYFHRPAFFNKTGLVVSTSAGSGLNPVLKYLTMVMKIWGFKKYYKFGIITHPLSPDLSERKIIRNKIRQLVKSFIYSIKSNQVSSPGLVQLTAFRLLRTNSLISDRIQQIFTADYNYYKTLRGKNYYYHIRINPFKLLLAFIIEKIILKISFKKAEISAIMLKKVE